jgi:hypothetical protein
LELLKTPLFIFLVADVLDDRLLIQTHCTDTAALRREVRSREVPFLTEKFPMDTNRDFPFRKPTVLVTLNCRWDTQTYMETIRHRVSLHKFNLRPPHTFRMIRPIFFRSGP